MLNIEKLKLPIQKFEVDLENSFDDRFQKVKIWIAHTGENLNHTSFTTKTFEKMSKTLPYTPIVGYIKNNDDSFDFDGHNQKITIEDDRMEIEYLPKPYGFIPEKSNAKIEFREGKEWLTAEGYLWNKFPQAIDIIKNSVGLKPQSMEIDNVTGSVSDEGILNIEDARFSALCILGDSVKPAMSGSTIEMFSMKDANKDFKDLMGQMFAEYLEKGEIELEDNEFIKETSNEESTESTNEQKTTQDENKDQEVVEAEETTDEAEKAEPEVSKDEEEDSREENVVVEGEETVEEHGVVDESIDTDMVGRDVDTDTATDADIDNNNFAQTILKMQSKIEELEKENNDLKSFKAQVEKDQKKQILNNYSERLDKESLEDIDSKLDVFSIEELEREIAFCIIKNEQKNEEERSAKINSYNFNATELNGRYGSLDEYFQ